MKISIDTKFWEHDPERFKQLIGKLSLVYAILFGIGLVFVVQQAWWLGIIYFLLMLFNIMIWQSNVKWQGQKTLEKLKEEQNDKTRSTTVKTSNKEI